MSRSLFRSLILLCVWCACLQAQKANDVAAGKQLVAKSLEIRAQITNPSGPAEPFKIMGNLYFAGVNNGEIYLLTSPQGHIMFGVGYAVAAESVEKNIEKLGFKLTDICIPLEKGIATTGFLKCVAGNIPMISAAARTSPKLQFAIISKRSGRFSPSTSI